MAERRKKTVPAKICGQRRPYRQKHVGMRRTNDDKVQKHIENLRPRNTPAWNGRRMSTAKTPNLQPPRNVNTLANQRQTAAQRRMKVQRAKKR